MSQDQDPKAKPTSPPKQDNSAISALATLDFGDISKDLDDLFGKADDPLFGGTSTQGSSLLDDLFFSSTKKQQPLPSPLPADLSPTPPSKIDASKATDVAAFPQTSQTAETSAFPQTPQIAENAAFPQASQTADTSAFPQTPQTADTSAFPQTSQTAETSAFPQASQTAETSAFPQASQTAETSAFPQTSQTTDTSAFPQASQTAENAAFVPTSAIPTESVSDTFKTTAAVAFTPHAKDPQSLFFEDASKTTDAMAFVDFAPTLQPPPAAFSKPATPPPPPVAFSKPVTPPPPFSAPPSSPSSLSAMFPPPSSAASILPNLPPKAAVASPTFNSPPPALEPVAEPSKKRSMAQTIAFGPEDLASLRSIAIASDTAAPAQRLFEEQDHAETTAQSVVSSDSSGTPPFGSLTGGHEANVSMPPPMQMTGTPAFGTPSPVEPSEPSSAVRPEPSPPMQTAGTPAFGTPSFPASSAVPPPAQMTGTPAFGTPSFPASSAVPPPAQMTGTPPFGTFVGEHAHREATASPTQTTQSPALDASTFSTSPALDASLAVAPTTASEVTKKPERAMAQTLMFGFDVSQIEGFQKAQAAMTNDKEASNEATSAMLAMSSDASDEVPFEVGDFDSTSFGGASPFRREPSEATDAVLAPIPSVPTSSFQTPPMSSAKPEMNKTMAFGIQIGDLMGSGFPESTLEDIPMQAVQAAVREREAQIANQEAAARAASSVPNAVSVSSSDPPMPPQPAAAHQTIAFGAEEIAEAFKARAARMSEREAQQTAKPSQPPPVMEKKPAASQTLMFGADDVQAALQQRNVSEKKPAASQTLMFGAEDVQAALQQRNAPAQKAEERPVFAVTLDPNAPAARSLQDGAPIDSFFDALLPAQAIEQAVQERLAAQQAEQAAAARPPSPPPHPGVAGPMGGGAPTKPVHPGVAGPTGGAAPMPAPAPKPSAQKPPPQSTMPMRQPSAAPSAPTSSKIPFVLGAAAVVLLLLYVLGFVWPGFFK
ncbi:hypothetical protein L6R29_09775 [Myxococcota bacterium]|nr:hypothetical protein [Myxococcota bacterium]